MTRPPALDAMPMPSALSALLQLASSTLPVGAFSHSLGLEAAHAAGIVHDAASAERWIADYLEHVWAPGEAPLWLAQYTAWQAPDIDALRSGNDWLLATRETAELRLENEQTGRSLLQWLRAIPDSATLAPQTHEALRRMQPIAFATVHALAARTLGLDADSGLHVLGWSLAENLAMAALKLVPLGQAATQALLRRVAATLPQCLVTARATQAAGARNFAPMLAILSAQHEVQYSRLFRS